MTAPLTILRRFHACDPARSWVRAHPNLTPEQLWRACPDGSWLLWIAARLDVDRRYIVVAACACAQGVLHLVPEGEDRPRVAVETAIRWTQGLATLDEVRSAATAAAYAATATATADAADAADAATAADAAAAAYAATATATAADAAGAAAYAAAYAADAYAARPQTLRLAARRVRKVIPWRLVAARLEMQYDDHGTRSGSKP
jgi:hypothetical protein